jgi:hypothetical protein
MGIPTDANYTGYTIWGYLLTPTTQDIDGDTY